jgi:flagellar basal-body rod modification protein FlgD
MTTIAPLSGNTPTPQTTTQSNIIDDSLTSSASFDDFLTLLTAQLRNQDPLNPADGAEFVAQIAQFSAVEQQMATVNRLDQLIALQTGGSVNELADWVGKIVETEDGAIRYAGSTLTLTADAVGDAVETTFVIRDANDNEINRLSTGKNGGSVTWDGTNELGTPQADGVYSVELVYTSKGSQGPETTTRAYSTSGKVIEARLEDGLPLLYLSNGGVVERDNVVAVRAAPPS